MDGTKIIKYFNLVTKSDSEIKYRERQLIQRRSDEPTFYGKTKNAFADTHYVC